MGAAASLDNLDSDVTMTHPPDAMESNSKALAKATPAETSTPIPVEESNSIYKIEKELMSLYDDRIKFLEQQEQAASEAATSSFIATSPLVPSSDNPLPINPDLIERDVLISKFYNEAQSPSLTKEELEQDFFAKFRDAPQKTPLHWTDFQFRVDDASSTKWRFIAKGHSNTVVTVLRHLQIWIKITKIPEYNYNLIALHGVAVQVTLDSSLPIGAKLMNLKNGTGVYIASIVDHGELARSVGEKAKHCANVESLNGQTCLTVEDFKAIKKATPKSEKLSLVIKCLQPADCKLLWEHSNSEETEGSNTRGPKAQALPMDESLPPASDISMLAGVNGATNDIVPEPKRKRKQRNETNESRNVVDENAFQLDTNEDDDVRNPTTSNDTAKADTASSTPDKKLSSEASRGWISFKRKYKPFLEVELKSSGIHQAFASGRIWHQHKIRYAATCSDNCSCAYDLPFLTQNMVTDQLEKYPEWNNLLDLQAGDYPRGLMGNFAATFMPKLKAQYPSETSSDHLERLLSMWETHQRSNKFGKRCHENCKCEKSWEGLFCVGALKGKLPTASLDCAAAAPIPKKRKIAVSGLPVDGGQIKLTEITKRSSTIAPIFAHQHAKETMVDQQRSTTCKSDTIQEMVSRSGRDIHQKSQLQPYHIYYDSKSSLGFYCVTEKSKEPFYCKVISVFPHGPEPMDDRIHYETKILSYELVEGQAKAVSTPLDLKAGYDEARSTNAMFRVTFINTNVTPDSVHKKSRSFPKDWTNDGQWQGKCASGWDGGAFDSQKETPRHGHFKEILKSPVQPRKRIDGDNSKKFGSDGIRKRVQFSLTHMVRVFDVDGYFVDKDVEEGDYTKRCPKRKAHPQTTRPLSLSRLSISDVLVRIQKGCLNDVSVVQWFDHVYQSEIVLEKEMILKKLKLLPDDINLKRRARELELIKVVLKISLQSDQSAMETHSLYAWEKFQVCAKSIDGLGGSFAASLTSVEVSVTFDVAGRQENLIALPRMPFASRITFGDETPPYNVRNNHVIGGDRKLAFAVRAHCKSGVSSYQCKFLVQLSDLSDEESKYRDTENERRDMIFDAEPGGELGRAQICLRVSRVSTTDIVIGKHKAAKNRLDDLIEWISRFNNDLAEWNTTYKVNLMSLGPDMILRGRGSLICSAIYLKEPKQLERLLELNGGSVSYDCLDSAMKLTLTEPSVAEGADPVRAGNVRNEMIAILDRVTAPTWFIDENAKKLAVSYTADRPELITGVPESDMDATPLKASRDEQHQYVLSGKRHESETSNIHDETLPTYEKCGTWKGNREEGGEWLLTDTSRECRSFRTSHRCNKKGCPFVHVHRLTSADMEWAENGVIVHDMEGKIAALRKKSWLQKTKSICTMENNTSKILWSAAFETKREVCYAVGGPDTYGYVSSPENVSWYRKKSNALDALMRTVIVSQATKSKGDVPPGFVPPTSSFQRHR